MVQAGERTGTALRLPPFIAAATLRSLAAGTGVGRPPARAPVSHGVYRSPSFWRRMASMIRSFLWVATLLLALSAPIFPQVRSIDTLEVTVLPQPSWERPEKQGTGTYALKALSAKPNKITDEKEWLERNGLDLDRF